ncbi:hypothetical protein MJT46_015702 [Ovis ammon polii x Ovis aries]|nr:hypothetical protein MJT46_015702 [Ovis ammon polii x Ovis aries]
MLLVPVVKEIEFAIKERFILKGWVGRKTGGLAARKTAPTTGWDGSCAPLALSSLESSHDGPFPEVSSSRLTFSGLGTSPHRSFPFAPRRVRDIQAIFTTSLMLVGVKVKERQDLSFLLKQVLSSRTDEASTQKGILASTPQSLGCRVSGTELSCEGAAPGAGGGDRKHHVLGSQASPGPRLQLNHRTRWATPLRPQETWQSLQKRADVDSRKIRLSAAGTGGCVGDCSPALLGS